MGVVTFQTSSFPQSTTAVTSASSGGFTAPVGSYIAVAVSLLNTSASVTSMTDGHNTYIQLGAINNGTSIRIELWYAVSTFGGSIGVTANFSAASAYAMPIYVYTGVVGINSPGWGYTGTSITAAGTFASILGAQSGLLFFAAFASQSGDSAISSQNLNNLRTNFLPAAAAGMEGGDYFTYEAPSATTTLTISPSARPWAVWVVELESGIPLFTLTGDENRPIISPANPASHQVVAGQPSALGNLPMLVAEDLEGGVVGVAYSITISAVNGTPPYTITLSSGTLPPGLTLNSSTGVISGTPTTVGTYVFALQVTDSVGNTGTQTFQIIISAPSSGGGGSFTYAG